MGNLEQKLDRITSLLEKMRLSKQFLADYAKKVNADDVVKTIYEEDAFMLQLFINMLNNENMIENLENIYKDSQLWK